MAHKAVFLDMGGTLVTPTPSVGEIYSRCARKYGMCFSPGDADQVFSTVFGSMESEASLVAHGTEKSWWHDVVERVVDQLAPPCRFDEFFEEVYTFFTLPDAWHLYPDVKPALASLNRLGLRLAIVSNWDSRLVPLCERLGLSGLVEFVAASALVGSAKPDPAIFNYALGRMGIDPSEALHVGDSAEKDYDGARAAGLDALLICREGPGDSSRRACIAALTEVPAHLLLK